MSAEDNQAIVRRYQDALNRNDLDALDDVVAADVKMPNALPGFPPGLKGAKLAHQSSLSVFSEWHVHIDDMVADEDKVAVRVTMSGVHTGPLGDIPPTGKSFKMNGVYFVRIAGGQIVEHWGMGDTAAMMQQLGLASG